MEGGLLHLLIWAERYASDIDPQPEMHQESSSLNWLKDIMRIDFGNQIEEGEEN